jgi:DNA repair protein RecO (recombination protein O)
VWLAPAYVLHQYAYRDTSRIVEVFTADHGRLTLFARGANGSKSALRGVLRPFQRMLVSWSGKGEACQLVAAEIDGQASSLAPQRLMSGFYLNELLLKLTERCDPHPEIFFSYASCVQALCDGEIEEPALRRFEKRLLNDLGYGLELARTGGGVPVDRDGYYRFALQSGLQSCVAETPGAVYGQSLADLQAERFSDARSLRDAKRILRAAIDECLDGRSLKSREVALALRHREPLDAHRPPDAGAPLDARAAPLRDDSPREQYS